VTIKLPRTPVIFQLMAGISGTPPTILDGGATIFEIKQLKTQRKYLCVILWGPRSTPEVFTTVVNDFAQSVQDHLDQVDDFDEQRERKNLIIFWSNYFGKNKQYIDEVHLYRGRKRENKRKAESL